jgi:dihydroorotase
VKYYPRGATTNSEDGIREIEKIYPKLEVMEEIGMPLLMHGEEVEDESGEEIDPYDREDVFLDRVYWHLRERFPRLKISLEHISTIAATKVAKKSTGGQYQFTVCPQHLLRDRRDVMRDGNQPDLTCMPRIKRKEHKEALRELITLGLDCVALGSDDAIHPESGKVRATGCNCGCFTSPYALELYAQVFDEMHALAHFNAFASLNAPRFFNLDIPKGSDKTTLIRSPWSPSGLIPILGTPDYVRPMGYREDPKKNIVLQWQMRE